MRSRGVGFGRMELVKPVGVSLVGCFAFDGNGFLFLFNLKYFHKGRLSVRCPE